MYQISQELQTALEHGPVLLRVLAAGETLEPIHMSYTASCAGGEALGIGDVCAASVRIKLPGRLDLQDAAITVEAGAQTGEQATYLPLGCFVVAQQERGEDTTTITAYDAAYYALGAEYVPNETIPATALAVLADICGQTGLTLGSTAGLTDQPVTGDLTGHTCREMAGYMAALLGCNALIGRDGNLELRWFADSGAEVTADDYYSGGLRLEGASTLAGVRMSKKVTAQDGTEETVNYDAGSGSGTVIAVENPYATQAIVDDVWTRIGSLGSYRAGRYTLFGGLLIEPGDLVTVTDREGVSATVPVMSVTLELDGGCKCTLESAGKSDTAVAANVQGPTGRALTKLAADIGAFRELTADKFTVTNGRIDNLWANSAFIESLLAQNITATGTISGVTLTGANIQSEAGTPGTASYSKVTIAGGQIVSEGSSQKRMCIDEGHLYLQINGNEILLDPNTEDYGYGLVVFTAGRQMPSYYTNRGCYVQGDIVSLGNLTCNGNIPASFGPMDTWQSTSIICAGLISGGQTSLQFFIPSSRVLAGTATCKALSVVVRHGGGGYAYARSGANGATYTPLGSSLTSIWANGATVRSGEVTAITCTNRTDGVQINVTFGYQLAKASGNPTAVTNNIPAVVTASATIVFS